MRRALIAGNWKMNGTLPGARALADGVCAGLEEVSAEVALFPPYVHLPAVAERVVGSPVLLGAQDLCERPRGACTGDVAGEMLVELGCRLVLVGHSERRALRGESNELVAAKFMRALECGLTPVLCLGETLEEREAGRTEAVVGAQLDAVTSAVGARGLGRGLVAYEPVWAIGTGRNAAPSQAQAVHRYLRGRLEALDAEVARSIRVLYGGSVKAGNASELFAEADVDGGLVGGASLDVDGFLAICRAAS